MTEKQRNASRSNGALSQGPKTEEGKRRSSQNAQTHGLFAKLTVLDNETRKGFGELVERYRGNFRPVNDVEEDLVGDMISARWRLWRLRMIEKEKLNHMVEARFEEDERLRTTNAFWELVAAGPQIGLLNRYETKLLRDYHRSLDKLLRLRDRGDRAEMTIGEAEEAPEEPVEEQMELPGIWENAA